MSLCALRPSHGARPQSPPSAPPGMPSPSHRAPPPLFRPLNWTRAAGSGHITPAPPGGAGQESSSALQLCLHPSPTGAATCVITCSLQLSGIPRLRDSRGAKAGRGGSPCPAGQGPRGRPLQALGGLLSAPSTRPSRWPTAGPTRTVPRGRRGRTVMVSGPTLQGLPRLGAPAQGTLGGLRLSFLSASLPQPLPRPHGDSRAWGLSCVSKA